MASQVRRSALLAMLQVALALALAPSVLAQRQLGLGSPAAAYLEEVLGHMEAESINRYRLDWTSIRTAAYRLAEGADTPSDTYPAIFQTVAALGDGHSFFRPSPDFLAAHGIPEGFLASAPMTLPEARRLDGNLGYIRIPGFSGPNPDEFATAILEGIRSVDEADTCGWIVDLRGNTGGNMWPMVQGLSPLLGNETPGYFLYPDGAREAWVVDTTRVGGYTLRNFDPAVAILYDESTASSGEAVAVAFRGRGSSRSFGEATAGLSTSNRTIPLSDGAALILTVAIYEDRLGNDYGGEIEPDQVVPASEAQNAAVAWLLTLPGCR